MYLRANKRKKDGKEHRYWSVEESRRLRSGRVVQRRVLYLGEINDSQQAAWRKTLEVFDEAEQRAASLSLFPEDRALPADALDGVQVKLQEMELRRPRAFGNYWLGCELWRQLGLGEFWEERLGKGREEVPWAKVLELLVVSRLVAPGSEFRLHRQGFDQSAMGDLLGTGFAVAEKDRLYRCLDRIGEHQTRVVRSPAATLARAVSGALRRAAVRPDEHLHRGRRRGDSQGQARLQPGSPRRLPAGGDRAGGDAGGISAGLRSAGGQHLGPHHAARISGQDRSAVRTGAARVGDGPGDSHGRSAGRDAQLRGGKFSTWWGRRAARFSSTKSSWLELPWQKVRESVEVKLFAEDGELYVLAKSEGRHAKERAMRRRKLVRLLKTLRKLRRSAPARDQLLLRIGAAKKEAGRAFGFVPLRLPREGEEVTRQTFTFHLDKEKLQKAELRDGHYLLRSNLLGEKPEVLWEMYILLAQIEAAFRTLKSELGLRPIYHQVEKRVEAHIFVAFLAYALSVTLRQRLAPCAPGLTPRAVLEKLATIQMLDVCLPTTDGRWLIMPRYTQPEPEQMLLLHQLHLSLPSQPPPRIKPAETVTNQPVQLKM